ncbi:MAG: hypothetical protein BAJALOKI3v1_1100002 [Promethearchaeota archaeon]|nr:MAG: hypothetical protein BAJALOKI3v1_1100002 [Candidatus Lokiarchaeota archaeon]
MKKKRIITLKDPKLRKIRKNLRELLLKAFSERLSEVRSKKDKIRENPDLNYYEKKEKLIELQSIIQDLTLAKNGAPLSCSTCKRIDIDLVYNPVFEEWYCEECYEFNSQGHKDWFP